MGGFSLIDNAMQRWKNVVQVARTLQLETGAAYVLANMYVTPGTYDAKAGPNSPTSSSSHVSSQSAFEAHWD